MFEKLWISYPNDLCNKKRGGKQPALKAFKKINPDEAEFNRMMANMKAQVREDRKNPKDAYRWPFISSYLNQGRYDDYIESSTSKEKAKSLKTCATNGCDSDVHGSMYTKCAFHCGDTNELLSGAYRKLGLDIKSPDFVSQCRDICRDKMGLILSR